MANEFVGNNLMAHDVVEVDIPTLLGEVPLKSPPDPLVVMLKRFKGFLAENTVLVIGEIPHSSFETAYDITTPPKRSLVEKMRSRLSNLVPTQPGTHQNTQ